MQVTEKGLIIERLNDIHARLVSRFKSIYGNDINVDPDTPDGQMIGIFSQSLADINEVIAFITQMLDPYQATGAWLEQRALYAGLVRKGAEYSYINDVIITGTRVVTVPQGAVMVDGNNVRWVTLSPVTLDGNGSARVNCRSESLGAFALAPNEALRFETVFAGVENATTTQASKEGKTEESDASLLRRFMMSHSINNDDDREGIQAALLNVTDVKKALVLENHTNQIDADTGLPPHSLNAIVFGGTDNDIALTLIKKKVGGAAFVGDQEVLIHHNGMNRIIRFDRPQQVKITVALTFKRLRNYTDLPEQEIEETLRANDFNIAQDVFAMRLVCGINTQDNFNLEEITVNGADRVSIGWREFAVIDKVEITIV